ncbi:phage tail family protein [Weissella confusa]|uniref:phage tail domain-containing protein n=1 Tax=Weissella confusa TaxID=1583 RepID=UPI001C6F8AEF|nr:phage tail domain-containing protein [Weissella confusa]QYU58214.1 phage tail family protein [Weissella confusa]
MDLLIENDFDKFQLSTLGVLVTDIVPDTPSIHSTRTSINFRNGKVWSGAVYDEKEITVTGYYYAFDEYADQEMKDKLNFIFATTKPYYIAPMFSVDGLYEFERPGESNGEVYDEISQRQFEYKYRWHVILSDVIDYEFQGASTKGLLTKFTLNFVTADIPFGMSLPIDEVVTGQKQIIYTGTAAVSQLEWPFYFELVAGKNQSESFDIQLGKRTFKYNGVNSVKAGDVFEIRGTSFLLNGLSVNEYTNFEYFELNPGVNQSFSTTFSGDITLKNKVNFYI